MLYPFHVTSYNNFFKSSLKDMLIDFRERRREAEKRRETSMWEKNTVSPHHCKYLNQGLNPQSRYMP